MSQSLSLAAYLHYTALRSTAGLEDEARLATLVLNRPDAANAFSGELLVRITELLNEVKADPSIRVLTIQGSGKHFSAGADLMWMKESAQLKYEGNLAEARKLTAMFEGLTALRIPTIAVVKGAVFGGAVGLLAACDYAFAEESAKVCLSEAKIGLIPAVILPYLQRKIAPATLHRMAMSSPILLADQLLKIGLVQDIAPASKLETLVRSEINALLQTSPEAQAAYKNLSAKLSPGVQNEDATAHAIATIRASAMGQHGLQSFFRKEPPNWVLQIPDKVSVLIP
jgi:methylglutaconyl-CoA hydratase